MGTILITGGQGQLGLELGARHWGGGLRLDSPGRSDLDITNHASVDRYVRDIAPAAIINAAAYTAVDRAEDEPEQCYAVNAYAPLYLSTVAADLGIPLVHVSTDYVFGSGEGYRAEIDKPSPVTVYGASKLAGELAVVASNRRASVVRTAWVVSPHRSNFVKTMLRLAGERDSIAVVDDQRGSPTSAADLAGAVQAVTLGMLGDEQAPTGIFHFVNAGEASWAELAAAVMDSASLLGLPNAKILPIMTEDYPTRAQRPKDSRLGTNRIQSEFGVTPRPWRQAVTEVVAAIAANQRMEMNS